MNTQPTNAADDWDRLIAAWQAPDVRANVAPEPLARRVRTQLARDAVVQAANWLVGAGVFALTLWRMAEDRSAVTFLYGFAVLFVIVAALEWSWRTWRARLAPGAATTAEYVRFLTDRAALARRQVVVGWLIYAALAATTLGWFVARGLTEGASEALADRMALAIAWYGATGAVLWAWARRVRRRAEASEAALREFESG